MKSEHLEWDSAFFGRRVFRLQVEDAADTEELVGRLCALPADVAYVFVPAAFAGPARDPLTRAGGVCYDHKVTYVKRSLTGERLAEDACIGLTRAFTPALERLAHASGWRSRFFLDPKFRPAFKALYSKWLDNACRSADDKVLVARLEGVEAGMTTLSIRDGKGRIGLVAVAEAFRGQQVGHRLMRACDRLLLKSGAQACEVVTQNDNVAACRLYEASGYVRSEESEVWHVWKTTA